MDTIPLENYRNHQKTDKKNIIERQKQLENGKKLLENDRNH